jgi:hypothetical protein
MRKEAPPNAFLAAYRDRAAGVNWRNVGLAGGILLAGGGLASWLLLGFGDDDSRHASAALPSFRIETPAQRGYSDLAREPEKATPPTDPPRTAPATNRTSPAAAPKRDELFDRARDGDVAIIAAVSPQDAGNKAKPRLSGVTTSDPDGTDFQAGAACQVNAGTAIRANLDTAITTATGGTVRARVAQDVWDTALGSCLAIPAGSVFVGDVKRSDVRGQRRAEMTFTMLTRPHPRNDTLSLDVPGSDAMGRTGLPGRVNSHLGSQALLVLASTAVDLGKAALIGGPFGALAALAGNAGSPLDKAARDQLDRPPEIEVDPLVDERAGELTLILRTHINADEFRR